MSTQTNKEIVHALLDAHFKLDRQRVGEILSPKLVWHMSGMAKPMSREDYLQGLEMGAQSFSDMKHTIDATVAEGDRVVVLSRVRMRHTGAFQGIAPSHRELEFPQMWMYRVVDRKVVEAWAFHEDITARLR